MTSTLRTGELLAPDGASIPFEVSGSPSGVPALYLHGGPGSLLGTGYRDRAPADRTLVVGLQQRRDVALEQNTTEHLLADIEQLREHLGIRAWILQGVSWGSTLALAYAQRHPDRVLGIVLMAVTTTSRREVDWITEGIGAVFPEAWDALAAFAEDHGTFDRHDTSPHRVRLVEAYRRILASEDPELVDAAAQAWWTWEQEHIRIGTGEQEIAAPPPPADDQERERRRTFARLVTHYWAHDGFLPEGIRAGMDRISHIPAVLIHGRRDVSGPLITAWELHRDWPAARLHVVEDEGHGGETMVQLWEEAMEHLVSGPAAPGSVVP